MSWKSPIRHSSELNHTYAIHFERQFSGALRQWRALAVSRFQAPMRPVSPGEAALNTHGNSSSRAQLLIMLVAILGLVTTSLMASLIYLG